MSPPQDDLPKRRVTRTWREGKGDFRFEVVTPEGHTATGAGYKTEASAKKAAKSVEFAKPGA